MMDPNPLALIIEDDPDLAFIFANAVNAAEFETEVVHNGAAALARLTEVTPKLVLLDLNLPDMSGADILHHIRTNGRLGETHIMVTTANPIMAESLQNEADLVLIKPTSVIQMRDLAARLRLPAAQRMKMES